MTGMQVIEDGRITDSASIVPISHVDDVTASRAIDGTVYTNTTGRTIYLFVSIVLGILAIGDYAQINIYVNSLNKGGVRVQPIGGASPIGYFGHIIPQAVPPGATYRFVTAVTGTGTVTKNIWTESY